MSDSTKQTFLLLGCFWTHHLIEAIIPSIDADTRRDNSKFSKAIIMLLKTQAQHFNTKAGMAEYTVCIKQQIAVWNGVIGFHNETDFRKEVAKCFIPPALHEQATVLHYDAAYTKAMVKTLYMFIDAVSRPEYIRLLCLETAKDNTKLHTKLSEAYADICSNVQENMYNEYGVSNDNDSATLATKLRRYKRRITDLEARLKESEDIQEKYIALHEQYMRLYASMTAVLSHTIPVKKLEVSPTNMAAPTSKRTKATKAAASATKAAASATVASATMASASASNRPLVDIGSLADNFVGMNVSSSPQISSGTLYGVDIGKIEQGTLQSPGVEHDDDLSDASEDEDGDGGDDDSVDLDSNSDNESL